MYYEYNRPEEQNSSELTNDMQQPIPGDDVQPEEVDVSAPQEQPVKKGKKQRVWIRTVALCLVCAILGSAGGVVGSYALLQNMKEVEQGDVEGEENSTIIHESKREPTAVTVVQTNTGKEYSLEEIYAAWVNSSVGISTEIVTTNWFGQTVSAAAGSGFVISADGYIVTNYHVVEGANSIKVTFYDGTVYDAVLVGGESDNDVAVLKIEAEGLTPVIIGDSDTLHVGQTVTAIGNPLGELTFSQSYGIVSAKDRVVTFSDGSQINMLQTDCTINSGNSGGPLFNLYGEVIGITSAKYSNNGSSSEATIEGIGFAIPMNDVTEIIYDLIEYGYVTGKPNVGILLGDVDMAAQRYGIPAGSEVLAVLEGSCADKGGLQVGDIVTAVNDTAIRSTAGLQSAVGKHKAGDTVTFTVYRSGETVELRLTLDESNQERTEALNALNEEYSASQQQNQAPGGYGNGNSGNGGYGYGWPFGW